MGHQGFLRILIVVSIVSVAKAAMPLTPDYYVKAADKTQVITEICKRDQTDLFEEHVITFIIAHLTQNDEACQIKFEEFYKKQMDFIKQKITAYNAVVEQLKKKIPQFIGLWIEWNFLSHLDILYKYMTVPSSDLKAFMDNSIAGFESYFRQDEKDKQFEFDSVALTNLIGYIKLSKTELENTLYAEHAAIAKEIILDIDSKYLVLFKVLLEKFGALVVDMSKADAKLPITDDKHTDEIFQFVYQSTEYFSPEQSYAALFSIQEDQVPAIPTDLPNHFLTNSDNFLGGKVIDDTDPENLQVLDTEDSYRVLADMSYFMDGRPFVGFQTLSSIVQFTHKPSKEFVAYVIETATAITDERKLEAFRLAYHLYIHLSMTARNPAVKTSKYLPEGHKKVPFAGTGKCDVVKAIFEFILSKENCLNTNYKGDFSMNCPLSITLGVHRYAKGFPYLYVLLKGMTDCGIDGVISTLVAKEKTTNPKAATDEDLVKSLPVWKMLTPMALPYTDSDDDTDKQYKQVSDWINEGKTLNAWAGLFRKARKLIMKFESEEPQSEDPKTLGQKLKKGENNYYYEKQVLRKKMKEIFAESTKFTKDGQNILIMDVQTAEKDRDKFFDPLLEFLKSEEDDVIKFFVIEIFHQILIKIATEYDAQKKILVANKAAEDKGEAGQEVPPLNLEPGLQTPEAMKIIPKIIYTFIKMLVDMINDDVTPEMAEGLNAYLTKTFVVLGGLTPEYYEYVPANTFRRIDSFLYIYKKNTDATFRTTLVNKMKASKAIDGKLDSPAKWEEAVFNDNFFLYAFTGYESFGELIGVFDLFSENAFVERQTKMVESPFLKSYVNTFDDLYSILASMRLKSAEFGFSPLVHTWKIIHFCSGLRLADSLPVDAELPEELCPLSYSNLEEVIFILLIYMASVDVSFEQQYEIWSQGSPIKYPAVNLTTLFEMAMSDEYFHTQFDNFCQLNVSVGDLKVPAKAKKLTKRMMDALTPTDLETVWKSRPICLGFDFVVRTVSFLEVNPFKEPSLEVVEQPVIEEGEEIPKDSPEKIKRKEKGKNLKIYSGTDKEGSFDSYEISIEIIINFLESSKDLNYNAMIWTSIASLYQMDQFNDGFQNLMNRGVTNGFDSIKYKPASKLDPNNQVQRDEIIHKKFYKVLCMYDETSTSFKDIALPMVEYVRLRFKNKYNYKLEEHIQAGLSKLSGEGITYWAVGGKPIYELVEIGVKYGTNDAATYELLMKNVIEDSLWFAVLRFQTDGGGLGEDSIFAMLGELNDDPAVKVHDGVLALIQTKEAEFVEMYQTLGSEPIDEGDRTAVEVHIKEMEHEVLDDLYLDKKRSSLVNPDFEDIEAQVIKATDELEKFDGMEVKERKSTVHVTERTYVYEPGVEEQDDYNQDVIEVECRRMSITYNRASVQGTSLGTNSNTNKQGTNVSTTNKSGGNVGSQTNVFSTNTQSNSFLKDGVFALVQGVDLNEGGNVMMNLLQERKSLMEKTPPDRSSFVELQDHMDTNSLSIGVVGGGGGSRTSLSIYSVIDKEEEEIIQDDSERFHRVSMSTVRNSLSETDRNELNSKVIHESRTSFQEHDIDHDTTIETKFQRQIVDDAAILRHKQLLMAQMEKMQAYMARLDSRLAQGDNLDPDKMEEMVGEMDEYLDLMNVETDGIHSQAQEVYGSIKTEGREYKFMKQFNLVCDVI